METRSLTDRWRHRLFRILESGDAGKLLKEAALAGALGVWTKHLTGSVVAACREMGWRAAARGHLGDVLPVARNEYLALDVIAFSESEASWPLPVAIFELENSRNDDLVAYSLWKVLCVRTTLRVVLAYRSDVKAGVELVGRLTGSVIGGLSIDERRAVSGETSLIIGNRGVAETFPYGYFKAWTLDTNTGRFDQV
jgi:hypothetical protein